MSYNEPGVGDTTHQGTPQATSGRAIAALALGMVGLLSLLFTLFTIASVLAIFLGLWARREIKAADGRLSGDGMATAGVALGVLQLCLFGILIVLLVTGVLTV